MSELPKYWCVTLFKDIGCLGRSGIERDRRYYATESKISASQKYSTLAVFPPFASTCGIAHRPIQLALLSLEGMYRESHRCYQSMPDVEPRMSRRAGAVVQ